MAMNQPGYYPYQQGYQQPYYQPPMQDQLAQLRGMQYQQQAPSQPAFICFPVSSREEAVASRVDAFGPPLVMIDMGHGKIYYKRFNEKTALADFIEFRNCPPQEETAIHSQQQTGSAIDIPAIFGGFSQQLNDLGAKVDSLIEKYETKPSTRQARKGQVENERSE